MLRVLFLALLSILPAKPDRYVTDHAGVFTTERADALNAKLADFERDTSNQVLVYIDKDIPEGTTLEEMSVKALTEWGVGQKGKDNGAILFLFTDARKYRIEVGYGLEGVLTDAKSKRITNETMKPLLKNGDMPGAVEAGVNEMLTVIRGEGNAGTGQTVAEKAVETPAGNAKPAIGEVIVGLLIMLVGGILCVALPILLLIALVRRVSRSSVPLQWPESPLPPEPEIPRPHPTRQSSGWFSPTPSAPKPGPPKPSPRPSPPRNDGFKGGGGRGGGGGASDSW